jgi:hypothetical protein
MRISAAAEWFALAVMVSAQTPGGIQAPRFWNDRELSDWATPVVGLNVRPGYIGEREYYATPDAERVFTREGCATCHTPPLYTNNKLTLATGFTPPANHPLAADIMPISVGTDPNLALRTRKGTGFYKVPSLKGVWYRGLYNHDGSVASLEDWFDPARLRDDYVPSGFKGYKVNSRAVPGHRFGFNLSTDDKAALIAFLRTL